MKLHIEEKNGEKLVKLQEKRLDVLSVSNFKESFLNLIQPQRNNNIVLDISDCSYCDTSGLGTLVVLHKKCNDKGGKLTITGMGANIKMLMRICNLDSVLYLA